MTLKTSLFNRGLIISDFKRWWWISALYGLFLLFILPFNHLVQDTQINNDWVKQRMLQSLDIFSGNDPQVIFICTVPVILTVLIFHYLHNNRAAAVMHSLPFTRKALFINHLTSGLVLLLLPVAVTGLSLIALNLTSHLKEYYSLLNIFKWMGLTALFNTLLFSITVFVGMFTGNALAQIAFTYVLQVLPTGIVILIHENLRHLLHGYAVINTTGSLKYNFPLILFLEHHGSNFLTLGAIIAYLSAAVIFLAAAVYAYKYRHTETAGDIIAFPAMRPFFKYGVTACTMLLVGVSFSSISNGALHIIILGYLIGSLIGYYIAEVLIQKTLIVWASYKGYLGYSGVMLLLLLIIATDATGFTHRIPNPEDVQKVYFGAGIHEWMHPELAISNEQELKYENSFYKNKDNIKNISLLHKELIQSTGSNNGMTRYIIYSLKNGDNLIRQYNFDDQEYAALLKPIYESVEYKHARFPVITQNPDKIKMIEIMDSRTPKRPAVLTSSEEIKEFASCLKEDIINTSFRQLTDNMQNDININITGINDKYMNYNLRTNYTSTIKWLKDKGYYQQIMLLPEEIEYVELEYPNEFIRDDSKQLKTKRVTIKDQKVIEELLSFSSPDYLPDRRFIYVNFYGGSGSNAFQFNQLLHLDRQVSDELKSYIEELEI